MPFPCEVAQLCLTLSDPMDCSLPGSSVQEIFQARVLEWGVIVFSSISVFSKESVLHIRWPKYWSFSFSPSNEYSGLIFFRMDLLDLFAVQRTLKSLLQHHSSKASVLQCSVQFSCSIMSNSLRPHEPQRARPPCPSPTPEFTQTHVH